MKPRISIRDLAAHLRVSHTTVSLALRNSPRIVTVSRPLGDGLTGLRRRTAATGPAVA